MVILIHRKKLIVAILFIISLFFLAYVDISQKAETFFKSVNTPGVKTVIIDPGHGGEDPGAVSDYSKAKEKDINLKIALNLRGLLIQENYKVIMTRSEDILKYEPGTNSVFQKRKQDLNTRKKLIDESGADIAVSIHLNKFPQQQYYGGQVFFPPEQLEAKRLADNIQLKIRELVDPNNKREALVKKDPIIILKNPKIITAVVECGFLSNSEEEAKLITEDYQKKIALSIKEGIKCYFTQKSNLEQNNKQ